ncbi:MAG: hypothetical protein A2131_01885 [Candidatus Sungbacteria bacterium GWC2_49_10]|uniref:Uncharacterized protein n=2 Tax=Parcubacteria group TaxID=1794811 RepID=A0A0G1WS40_9BACT|nr:MAG: hypothetical protein UY60_C0012G0009 [Parcubacteria group bacterium GW2011_GWB1_50_9]KKW21400.1 MAG: hypothetical protein UY61_C0007G0009 [Candidatus Adlerbacteria bacterium GW2011_GWC1_50_9]OGZ93060.1 MAG: hypothetical protein A2131_01885 [Candidatus Sungbacteria bacterium GWC2_49_10]
MKIFVTVKPNTRTRRVAELDSTHLLVSVNAPARRGEANTRLIEILAEYYNIPTRSIKIAAGFRSRKKIVVVE